MKKACKTCTHGKVFGDTGISYCTILKRVECMNSGEIYKLWKPSRKNIKKSCRTCTHGGTEEGGRTYCKIRKGIECWWTGKKFSLWRPSHKELRNFINHNDDFIKPEEMTL